MSTPSSLKINLPPKFSNSFWSSPDYRRGVEAVYSKLQVGLDENACILSSVEHRTTLEYAHAEQLAKPSPTPKLAAPLFKNAVREGSSRGVRTLAATPSRASHAFRNIEAEATRVQAGAHAQVARTLERNIMMPFGKWSEDHRDKVQNSWDFVDANLQKFERQKLEVERLRQHYETKCRQADEAEDDARFAGGELASPPHTSGDSEIAEKQRPIPQDILPTSRSTSSIDSTGETDTSDPDQIKRRETIRQQFGFRKPADREDHDGGRYNPLNPRSTSAQVAESQRKEEDGTFTGIKRSNTISSALSSALSKATEVPAFQNLRAAVGVLNEPRHLRLRKESEDSEIHYKEAVRSLDKVRCEVEEILMDHFDLAEKWEASRLLAVKRVFTAFNAAFSPLLPTLSVSLQRSAALEPTLNPETALIHLILDARTGPYQPQAQVFHPYYHDDPGHLAGSGTAGFGMDLSAFMRAETLASEGGEINGDLRAGAGSSHKYGLPAIPLALMALLASLDRIYEDPSRWPMQKEGSMEEEDSAVIVNEEKRKSWIYEVPLMNSHLCRQTIISHLLGSSVPGANVGAGLETKLKRFDAPTLAATVKLWASELTDSLISCELWDAVDNTYLAAAGQEYDARSTPNKTVGEAVKEGAASSDGPEKGKGRAEGYDPVLEETIRKGVLADLGVILSKLPKINLVCLDAIVGHLAKLVKSTPTNESNSVYLNKAALSLGRVLMRPPVEKTSTLKSRAPVLLAHDLVTFYDVLFPSLMEKRAKESEEALQALRRIPTRKRTKPIDQRISRSRIASAGAGVPALPSKDTSERNKMASPLAPPKVETQFSSKGKGEADDEDEDNMPTPVASRILDTSQSIGKIAGDGVIMNSDTLTPSSADTTRVKSPSSTSAASSTYGTPDEAEETTIKLSKGSMISETPSIPAKTIDEEKSLSNVARLSRQFGSGGSGSIKSGVRGPRAANSSAPSTK
ncbi:hypothetical protein CBS101457_004250 [Exobasidium rhododendri]|nr:hypothetical protein CBS101457_004250 [Exobasidium rhododendri]